jgi:hypothetical protein
MERLNDYLLQQLQKNHLVVLLIDEAQDLSDDLLEDLRLLSNLETDSRRLVQIVLIGQPEFEQKLNQPELHQLKQRIALRCRLEPLSMDEIDSYIHCRLKRAGYQGKRLFEQKAVDSIGLRSQGIPRLINVICDSALLIAYASAKRQVTLPMVEEAARDLQLSVPSKAETISSRGDFEKSRGQREPARAEAAAAGQRVSQFQRNLIKDRTKEIPTKKKPRLAAGILVLILTTVIGAVIYSHQNANIPSEIKAAVQDNYISPMVATVPQRAKDYGADLTERMKDYSLQVTNQLSDLAQGFDKTVQATRARFYDVAVKAGDHLPGGRHQALNLVASAKTSMMRQWEDLKQSGWLPKALGDVTPNRELADSRLSNTNDPPGPPDESPLVVEPFKEADSNSDVGTARESENIPEAETPELPATQTDQGPGPSAPPLPEPSPPDQITASAKQPSYLGVFEVVQNSFLRDKPESGAAVTILQAGNRIRVESKHGDYFLVRSLDDPGLRGYVHREDAFFERIR